jgi:hypothetical protein
MSIGSTDDLLIGNVAQLKEQIENVFQILNQKEKLVLEKRFALKNERRKTLAEIGGSLDVTRERVRQIEKCALSKIKRNIQNFGVYSICEKAFSIIKENGGIIREDLLLSKILKDNSDTSAGLIQLVLSVDNRFERILNTLKYHPHLRLAEFGGSIIDKVCSIGIDYLNKKNEPVNIEMVSMEIKKIFPEANRLNTIFFRSLFQVHKGYKLVDDKVGLIQWRNINPRTLRDKIYYILRKEAKPLHFVDIGNSIVNEQFDRKNINMQAVHNELIRHSEFVLVGRGLYALKEWGFNHGTVEEIISLILKDHESMSEEKIIEEVLKKRMVKPITIILNLKNKPQFTRIGRKQYSLHKS